MYESDVYNVNQTDGTTDHSSDPQNGDYLATYTWYDLDGNVIQTETGTTLAFTKDQYDALGDQVETYTGYYNSTSDKGTPPLPEAANSWAWANTVNESNTILDQTQTSYDAAGKAVASATYQQFASASPEGGVLGAGDAATGVPSYATASATWYDALGRTGRHGRLRPRRTPVCRASSITSSTVRQ